MIINLVYWIFIIATAFWLSYVVWFCIRSNDKKDKFAGKVVLGFGFIFMVMITLIKMCLESF